jgi:hypothetical protein
VTKGKIVEKASKEIEEKSAVQSATGGTMNPFAAKRLSLLLNNVVKEYESRFGKLKIEA